MTFALRLISIPLLEYVIWRWLRKPYLEITRLVRRGWLLFAALTGIIYFILVLLSVYPTIFLVLFEQFHNLKAQERQRVLEAQTIMMSQRVEDILRAEETKRIERHDMRHQLQTVASLAQRGDMEIKIGLLKELPIDVFELSIVFANALENAIHAVKELPENQRRIICKSVMKPRFMIEISNTYAGEVTFDQRGVPVADRPGHGIGTLEVLLQYFEYRLFYFIKNWAAKIAVTPRTILMQT